MSNHCLLSKTATTLDSACTTQYNTYNITQPVGIMIITAPEIYTFFSLHANCAAVSVLI